MKRLPHSLGMPTIERFEYEPGDRVLAVRDSPTGSVKAGQEYVIRRGGTFTVNVEGVASGLYANLFQPSPWPAMPLGWEGDQA